MMPVLSNFIYRPKRKNKALVPPFQIRHLHNATQPLDPYAIPPVMDINDGRMTPGETSEVDETPSTQEKDKEIREIPPMKLDLEFNDEPLGNLFPLNFLKADSPHKSPDRATGQRTRRNGVRGGSSVNGTGRHIFGGESSSIDEREEEEDDDRASSSEAVLANLEAMDATAFINVKEAHETNQPNPTPSSWRKLPPAPIRIPSYGHKTHLPRSREPSRPTSLISSVESSAVSGTTLARALMANSFAFSADHRGSRYRSGVSLARADSATLPRGEFSLLHSPYWRERTSSGGELTLSPSAATPPVPPVPDNAEQVYVPPKAPRHTSETRSRRHDSVTVSTPSERGSDSAPASPPASGELQVLRRTSRVLGQNVSPLPKPQDPAAVPPGRDQSSVTDVDAPKEVPDQSPVPLQPILPLDPIPSRTPSLPNRDSDKSSDTPVSPAASEPPSSGRDIDNVLDYYSLDDNPSDIAVHGFRPAFSPISEETSSQVSPASAYRRDLKKTPSNARSSINKGLSPFSAGVRVEWALHQRRGSDPRSSQGLRDGTTKPLLPIGERPRSIQVSPSSSSPAPSFVLPRSQTPSTTPSILALSASDSDGELAPPPPISTVFNRQRSGSTPSPIQVIRDIHDDTTYNITVSAVTEGSTPSTADGDVRQTFPETPSAFSPAFSTISAPSPGAPPQTPMSAGLPQRPGGTQHSLAQQMLLTRAATSVHGARPHSRLSVAKMNRLTEPLQSRMTLDAVEEPVDDRNAEKVTSTGPSSSESPEIPETPQNVDPKPAAENEGPAGQMASLEVVSATPTASEETVAHSIHQLAANSDASLVQQPVTPLEQVVLLPPITPLGPRTPPSSRSLGSGSSARSESPMESSDLSNMRPKGLPRIPPSPKMLPPTPPRPTRSAPPPVNEVSTSGPSSDISVPTVYRGEPSEWPPPRRLDPIDPTIFPLQASNPFIDFPAETQPQSSSSRPQVPPSLPPESHASPAYSPAYHSPHASFGSPPPYHTIVGVEALTPSTSDPTPSTSGSQDPSNNRFQLPNSSSPHVVEFNSRDIMIPSGQSSPSHRQSRGPRTRPSRPPLPAGPRRPSQGNTALPLSSLRSRGGSMSSLNSNLPSGSSSRINTGTLNLPPLKFEAPPPRWKGFTLDAAKWTFTSAQLQGIVSRAIRQSAEPSSIRLLRLETLDDEIPPEIQRLETQKSEIMLKYKTIVRRRANLLDTLSAHVDGSEEGSGVATRLVEELKEVSVMLDRLTEELHSTDVQLAQLTQLCITHSSSALAMALRKLNSSFLRQFAEAQTFRNQVEALEAERDEAWKHAEDLAMEYEELRGGKVDKAHPENRFGRVLASRKSSLRASKAGLRPSSRHYSYRSSMCSNRAVSGYSPSSSSRTPQLGEDIPPVPHIPRHRPSHIRTDIPMRNSVGLSVSTSGLTPNSDTRALARAQEDLYDMLGIAIDDNNLPRRPRSLGSQPEQYLQVPVSANLQSEGSSSGRRASLPGSAQPDVYSSLTADVSIMLTADRAGWI